VDTRPAWLFEANSRRVNALKQSNLEDCAQAFAMSRLHIIHETTYRYKRAVRFGPHWLVLRPREGHDVHTEVMRLKIEPEFELGWSRDLFGNCVATAHLLSPADRLRIHNEVVLHQMAPFPKRSVRWDTPAQISRSIFGNGISGCCCLSGEQLSN
jgi:transglutaminase superfamily protein